jgi:HEAT repeat protein
MKKVLFFALVLLALAFYRPKDLSWVARSDRETLRVSCAMALGDLGATEAVETLIDCLRDKSKFLRIESAEALGKIGDRSAVKALKKMAELDQGIPHIYAAEALYRLGERDGLDILLADLQNAQTRIKVQAALALGRLASQEALGLLREAAQKEQLRQYAMMALSQIADISSKDLFIEGLSDEDRFVRAYSASGLGGLGDKSAIPQLVQRLEDEDPLVFFNAAMSLKELEYEIPSQILEARLKETKDPFMCGYAGLVLANYARLEALSTLVQYAEEAKSLDLRALSAEALSILRDKMTPALKDTLGQRAKFLSENAAILFQDSSGRPLLSFILEQLNDQSRQVRADAAFILGKLENELAVSALVLLLKDEDVGVRLHTVEALGNFETKFVGRHLLTVLNEDKDLLVRATAARALGRLGEKDAVGPLIKMLKGK